MKILCFNDWIVERMKINPITRTELDKAKEVANQAITQRDAQAQAAAQNADYRTKKLRSLCDAATQYNRLITRIVFFSYDKFENDYNHTWYDRFEKWENELDSYALIKKHEQRSAKKNLSEIKRFVTMYCAFKMYGPKYDYTSNEIMKIYMNMLKKVHGVTDETIIDTFFE